MGTSWVLLSRGLGGGVSSPSRARLCAKLSSAATAAMGPGTLWLSLTALLLGALKDLRQAALPVTLV